jgi:hypothetical protein
MTILPCKVLWQKSLFRRDDMASLRYEGLVWSATGAGAALILGALANDVMVGSFREVLGLTVMWHGLEIFFEQYSNVSRTIAVWICGCLLSGGAAWFLDGRTQREITIAGLVLLAVALIAKIPETYQLKRT